MHYSTSSLAIKLYNTSNLDIAKELRENSYVNDRMPGRATFFDRSMPKIGRQKLSNRMAQTFKRLKFNWIGMTNPDTLRKSLKESLFHFLTFSRRHILS